MFSLSTFGIFMICLIYVIHNKFKVDKKSLTTQLTEHRVKSTAILHGYKFYLSFALTFYWSIGTMLIGEYAKIYICQNNGVSGEVIEIIDHYFHIMGSVHT